MRKSGKNIKQKGNENWLYLSFFHSLAVFDFSTQPREIASSPAVTLLLWVSMWGGRGFKTANVNSLVKNLCQIAKGRWKMHFFWHMCTPQNEKKMLSFLTVYELFWLYSSPCTQTDLGTSGLLSKDVIEEPWERYTLLLKPFFNFFTTGFSCFYRTTPTSK